MATFDELAEEYANDLRSTADQRAEIARIAQEIRGLYYIINGATIPVSARLRLVELVHSKLLDKEIVDEYGRTWIAKEADNKRYLIMVQSLRALLSEQKQ